MSGFHDWSKKQFRKVCLCVQVRQKLLNTRKRMEDILAGVTPDDDEEWYDSAEALAQPLLACYWSLWECGKSSSAFKLPHVDRSSIIGCHVLVPSDTTGMLTVLTLLAYP